MTSIAFDTHAAASRFKRAGFTDDQVEALVEVARETTALPDVSALATKADLEKLETRIDARFTQMEARTDARFSQVDARFAQVEAKIASSQVQTLTIMISATAFIVTLATVLSKIVP